MPTRNVVLTDHQASFVEQLVTTGRYQNASEVLREGLRLVERREAEDEVRLAALREAARIGEHPRHEVEIDGAVHVDDAAIVIVRDLRRGAEDRESAGPRAREVIDLVS